MQTIYVSIPSLDDMELPKTVASALESAEFLDRVILGVSITSDNKKLYSQIKKIKKLYPNNIRLKYTKISKSNEASLIGVGRGRLRAASMYDQEDFFLQVDSHTMFSDSWDSVLISLLSEAQLVTKNEKTILTAYAAKYYIDENGNRFVTENDNIPGSINKLGFLYPTFVDRATRNDIIPGWAVKDSKNARELPDKFVPSFKFNANFAFGNRHFANNLGISDREMFFDEELIQTLELMGNGFSLVFPNVNDAPVKHYYADHGTNEEILTVYKRKNIVLSFKGVSMGTQQSLASKNYFEYVSDPRRKHVVESYQRYAGINLLTAKSTKHDSFPESWKLDIFGESPYNKIEV